jgi:DNA-binding transcriptional MerR regulator
MITGAVPPVNGTADEPTNRPGPRSTTMTLEELAAATGLDQDHVRDLERFGLLSSRDMGGTAYFDAEALEVARLAAGFARHGVEARHLRMYKNAAERETGLFEQVVMPLFKQRNPQARRQAMGTVDELSRLGADLREALLRAALRDTF